MLFINVYNDPNSNIIACARQCIFEKNSPLNTRVGRISFKLSKFNFDKTNNFVFK